MRSIVITGGAGFIGSNLINRLVEENHVICIDNLISGTMENLQDILKHPHFELIEHDITAQLSISSDIDQIYDLACPASPVDYQEYPIETLQVCSEGVHNMLELAKEKNADYLFASTSEIYGEPLEHPQSESYWGNVNPIGQRSCYDEGKRFAESLVVNYRRRYGIKTKIVRIFNTYGPRMRSDDGRVISNLIVQALKGSDLTVYGDGTQTRSFCYVSDMVAGLVHMMGSDEAGPVNLGNPEEITVSHLAETILQFIRSKSQISYKPLPVDDPTRRRPDITLARQQLGWLPEVDLKNGLKLTIDWFKEVMER